MSTDKELHELDEEHDTEKHLAERHGHDHAMPKHGACPVCMAELDGNRYCYMCRMITKEAG